MLESAARVPAQSAAHGIPPASVRRKLWAALGAAAIVAATGLSFAAARIPHFAADVRISRAVQATDWGFLTVPMQALNHLGFAPLVTLAYGGVFLVLFAVGLRWEASAGTFGVSGSAALNHLAKVLVDRPRPPRELIQVDHHIANPSFPAGHVLNFTTFAGFLCCVLLVRARASWPRNGVVALLIVAMLLMGLARIDSGEHWPSDVLGGYLLGFAWLAVTVLFYDWGNRRRSRLPRAVASRAGALSGAIALTTFSLVLTAVPATAAPSAEDSLAASVEAPWNPPHPLPRRRAWEQAVLLPGRIVSLPLVAIGRAADHTLFDVEQSPRLSNLMARGGGASNSPVRLRTPRLGDDSGLGAAVEVQADVLSGALRSRVSAEYAGTLHDYGRTLVTWLGRPASLQFGEEWRPQEHFYGIGNDSRLAGNSDLATQHEFLLGHLDWAFGRDPDSSRPRYSLGLWGGPEDVVTRTGRQAGVASFETRYPALAAATLDLRAERLRYGVRLQRDMRAGAPHWSHGLRTLVAVERFAPTPGSFALAPDATDGASFTRTLAEVETGFSFMRDPRTVRLLVRMIDQQPGAHADRMQITDLASLGGTPGLGGFAPGRFRDMDMLMTRLDYIFPLERSLEFGVHSEWGAVYPDVWRDVTARSLHQSAGFSLRSRGARTPNGSVGFDFSRDGARLRFSIGGTE